jgi:hypothetical protein
MPSKADEARKIARKAKGIKEKRTIAYQGTEDRKDDEAVKELLQQMEQNIESEANDGNFTATLRVGLDVKDDVLDSVRTSLETDGFRVMLDKRGGVYKYVVASWSN